VTVFSRVDWGSDRPVGGYTIAGPVDEIFIHHFNSGIAPVTDRVEAMARIRSAQTYHAVTQGWGDLGYSWLVDDVGNIYEGRGWWRTGAHTYGHNSKGYGICWLGDSNRADPSAAALQAIAEVVADGIRVGAVTPAPAIVAHRDRVPGTACCGDPMYALLPVIRRLAREAETGTTPSSPPPVGDGDDDDMRAWLTPGGAIIYVHGYTYAETAHDKKKDTWPAVEAALREQVALGILAPHADGSLYRPITDGALRLLRQA
jgi:hypothetical protein